MNIENINTILKECIEINTNIELQQEILQSKIKEIKR